jgi:hypothetical protein
VGSDAFFCNSPKGEQKMPLSDDELKAKIVEKAEKSPKPQLYIKDFYKCDPDSKPRRIKNVANELVRESKLMFWSSGSTTMYAIPSRIQDEEK